MFKRLMSLAALGGMVTTFGLMAGATASSASTMPNGEVTYGSATFDSATGTFVGGGGTIEPAYDDTTGTLIYLQTPIDAPVHPAKQIDPSTGMPVNVAPIYITVYPKGSGIDPAGLNCSHVPADNCPDHGGAIAGAAKQIVPSVYGDGVIGHDHLAGVASTGGDYNVLWEPVLVLFTNPAAATHHLTTLAQINADLSAGAIKEVPLPQLDFNCILVSAGMYNEGTPAPTVTGP